MVFYFNRLQIFSLSRPAHTNSMSEFKRQKKEFLVVPQIGQEMKYPPRYKFSGEYLLAENCILSCHPGQISCTDFEFESLWKQKDSTPQTPNPYLKDTFIKRRQGTYGASYKFGKQKSENIGPIHTAPEIVRRCLADAKARAGSDSEMCTAVHVNWYDPGVGLGKHQDDESIDGVAGGRPIFSYSFVVREKDDKCPEKPFRFFVVYDDVYDEKRKKMKKTPIASVPTFNGDLIIMSGVNFQKKLFHAVPTTSALSVKGVRRINLTVRMWGGATGVGE